MTMDFVEVSRARGESLWWILWHEILPNAFIPLSTDFGLRYTFSILLLSALSFLGLGVQPPLPSWGLMISEGKGMIFFDPWLIGIPGAALFSLVLAINLLGDGLRDVTAPENRN